MRPQKLRKYVFSIFDKREFLPNKHYLIIMPEINKSYFEVRDFMSANNIIILTPKDSIVFAGKKNFLNLHIKEFVKLSKKFLLNY